MILLTPDKILPGKISVDTKEQGGHSGNTIVIAHLIVESSVAGNITVEKLGKMTVKGEITGNVINHGELIIESTAKIEGDLQNYGALNSKQISQIKKIFSEPNAFVEMKFGGGFNVKE